MEDQLQKKFRTYQLTVLFSVLFALIGFSYNVWRMEVSEENNTMRTASFEILLELSALEQLIYTAHYDQDIKEGSPRKGWVKVGLINDLSLITTNDIIRESEKLKATWANNWESIPSDQTAVKTLVDHIENLRKVIKDEIRALQ